MSDRSAAGAERRERGRIGRVMLAIWRWVLRVAIGLVVLIFVGFGVNALVNLREPTYWGTFTSEDCVRVRYGCQNIGTWVSDDGSIERNGIRFDGALTRIDTARASFRPTGLLNDAQNNIVHGEFATSIQYWLPWLVAIVIAGNAWPAVRPRRVSEPQRPASA